MEKSDKVERSPSVPNADNRDLGELRGGGVTIGSVDEVNGPGAEEIAAFVPTRHELLLLARYWAERAVGTEFKVFLTAQTGSTEIRIQPYAWARINRIGSLLGDCVEKIVEEVYEQFGTHQNSRFWQAFLHGTKEERNAVQLEFRKPQDHSEPE